MWKKYSKWILFVLIAALCFSGTVYAYEGDTVDIKKVGTWTQWGFPEAKETLLCPGGSTVSRAACGYFALTSVVKRLGTRPADYNPMMLIKEAKEKSMWNTNWGHFDFSRIEELKLGLKLPDISEMGTAKKMWRPIFMVNSRHYQRTTGNC